MPNAVKRVRNQLCKDDKDIENKDIRRKFKNYIKSEKSDKPESVWERLSRIKKTSSMDISVGGRSKSNQELPIKNVQRLRTARWPPSHARYPDIQALGPGRRLAEKRLLTRCMKTPQTIFFPDLQRENIVYLCEPVLDTITPRPERSKSPSDELNKLADSVQSRSKPPKKIISVGCLDTPPQTGTSRNSDSLDSGGDFEMPPLMPVPTRNSMTFSAKIANNFRGLLEQNRKTMPPDEITVIKNVVKTDERYYQLQDNDSELFKDILKTQLREILRQESVVQTALNHLDGVGDSTRVCPTSSESAETYKIPETSVLGVESMEIQSSTTEIKPRVDVIFKNVPSLEKEIIILEALGEKLRATLRRTTKEESNTQITHSTKTTSTSCLQINRIFWVAYFQPAERYVQFFVHSIGRLQHSALVKEYLIVQKTISELKQEANRHFYIPMNIAKTELQRTSFQKLKKNPDILLKHIKAKNSLVPVTVLEQNPMFFNKYIFNGGPTGISQSNSSTNDNYYSESEESCDEMVINEKNDGKVINCRLYHRNQDKEPLRIEEIQPVLAMKNSELHLQSEVQPKKTTNTKSTELLNALKHADGTVNETKANAENLVPRPTITEIRENKEVKKVNVVPMQVPSPVKKTNTQKKSQEKVSPRVFEPPIRGPQRRRITKTRTPMPMHKYVEPKNNLIRTVIIGIIQMSMFLILVMAVTYPDVKC